MRGKDFLSRYGFYGMHRFFTAEERDTIMAALDRPQLEAVPAEEAQTGCQNYTPANPARSDMCVCGAPLYAHDMNKEKQVVG